jgi:hypothetical protein
MAKKTETPHVDVRDIINVALTSKEQQAVCRSVRGSLDLYRRYVKLRPETPVMKRKQGRLRQQIVHLKSALQQLGK